MSKMDPAHQVSSLGFLPESCVDQLPTKFAYLQPLVDNLSTEDGKKYRGLVDELEVVKDQDFTMDTLKDSEIKFMYSITCMIINKYVWCLGSANATPKIPKVIGQPWINSADVIGIAPALTHAAVDLYNWSLIDPKKGFELDNLKSNYLMTGNSQEEWFYLIMVAIEGQSGRLLKAVYTVLSGLDFKRRHSHIYFNNKTIARELQTIAECMRKNVEVINRMYERCKPDFFFNKLRIYLSGSSNKEYFPDGFKIEGMEDRIVSYDGGSAAQSSLIQALDIFFSVKHDGTHKEFLDRMHTYMPKAHSNFLMLLKSYPRFCDYVNTEKDKELGDMYDECLVQLRKFRNCHFQIVHKYIVPFITSKDESESKESEEASADSTNVHGMKGSGGTEPEKFLGALIEDTKDARKNIGWQEDNWQWVWFVVAVLVAILAWYVMSSD